MSRPIDRILNSRIKENKFFGRIVSKTGLKFVVETNVGRMQVDVIDGISVGDNVILSGTTIIGKSGSTVKSTSVMV